MVGIVVGIELGLGTSSLSELGGEGMLGQSRAGRGGETIALNVATGNLVLRQRDEVLIGRGPDAELVRTYNSQGLLNDDPDAPDNWLPGWSKQVLGLMGTLNAVGSSIARRDADGALVRYSYSSGLVAYVSSAGERAHDSLRYDRITNTWTWTEGSTRVREIYAANGDMWRISARKDSAGNTLTYSYNTQGRLERLTTPAGESTVLDYVDGRLSQIRNLTVGGEITTRVRYAYDNLGRLSQVSVDLSPEDNDVADGNVYLTTYTYEGESTRLTSITQTDGTRWEFGYTRLSADHAPRIHRIVETVGDVQRVTLVEYDTSARTATLTDPASQRSVLAYDASNRLLSVQHPAVDGVGRTLRYTYDTYGNVASRTDARGQRTTFAYDSQGNRTLERDALGNTVTRLFSSVGQLLCETVYMQPDPDGAGSKPATQPQTTRYVYDAGTGTLARFALSAQGRVTEYRYDAFGQLVREIVYGDAHYEVSALTPTAYPSEAALKLWAAARDHSRIQLTQFTYDLRGQLESRTHFARVDATGQGVADGTESVTRYIYSPRGELLHEIDPRASTPRTLWSQDFSKDTTGLTKLPSTYMLLNPGSLTTYARAISGSDTYFSVSGTRAQTLGTVFRGEITTTAASAHRYLLFGADNANTNGVLRRHMVYFGGDSIYAHYRDSALRNVYLGQAKDNTTYVVEVATDALGSTLYVYEKGATRSSGFIDRRDFADWGVARTAIEVMASPRIGTTSRTDLDNLSERTALGAEPWSQDFGLSAKGLTTLPEGYMTWQEGRLTVSARSSMEEIRLAVSGTRRQPMGTTFRGEINTRAASPNRYLVYGADNAGTGGVLRAHAAFFQGDTVHAQYRDGTPRTIPLGKIKDDTLYVVEVLTDGRGSTLYVYEQGQRRESGFVDRRDFADWGLARSFLEARGSPAIAHPAAVDVLALSEHPAHFTSYVYDGLGRHVLSVDAHGTRTLVHHDDANRRTLTTLSSGVRRTSTFDESGALIGELVSDLSGTLAHTRYFYDNAGRLRMRQDPTGIRMHWFYDAASRKAAEVDGDGSLTEYIYDANDRLIATRVYASALSAQSLASLIDDRGEPRPIAVSDVRPIAGGQDRVEWRLYDAIGRLAKTVDPIGSLVEFFYDGRSQVIATHAYATRVTVAAVNSLTTATHDAVSPMSSIDDRVTRFFHDADGRQVGELEAHGALIELRYDAAGQLALRIRYANLSDALRRASGTLAELIPTAHAEDQITRYFHDARGQKIGELDGEGYHTELKHDLAGNLIERVRYATAVIAPDTRKPATSNQDQRTRFAYDALNRLLREAQPDGTVSTYEYDDQGLLLRRTVDYGSTDARTLGTRYDAQGRVLAELTGEGSAKLAGLTRAADIESLWRTHATRHTYDAAGRRTSSTNPMGARTRFFYDRDGRLTHTINALGELSATTYDAQGNAVQTTQYATRLSTEDLSSLEGGLRTGTFDDLIGRLDVAARTTTAYDTAGRALVQTDALGARTHWSYNAFGEVVRAEHPLDASRTLIESHLYDRRGRLSTLTRDPDGLAQRQSYTYDAFGRRVTEFDANGHRSDFAFDRLGRVVLVRDALGQSSTTTYDAFDGVLRITDRLNQVTSYVYDTARRSVEVISPEGVRSITTKNAHGEVTAQRDGNGGLTTYAYDRNGNRVRTEQPIGSSSATYDALGRLIESTDARGARITFANDGAGRLIERILDPKSEAHPGGLNISTRYRYDALGRALWTRDANGVWTHSEFDPAGQLVAVTIDPRRGPDTIQGEPDDRPQGLALRTEYRFDAQGHTLSVTEGVGTFAARTTCYVYDVLGRRIEERVDPSGLNLSTRYAFDARGNLIRKTNAAGFITRYAYDANDRLIYTVDALNQVSARRYDAEGHLIESRLYARALALSVDAPSGAEIEAALTPDAADRVTRHVFDADGRSRYAIDASGAVTGFTLDANGNVLRETRFATRMSITGSPSVSDLESALRPEATRDRRVRHVYDNGGRRVASMDALGYVSTFTYDALGHLLTQVRHANALTGTQTIADLRPDAGRDAMTRHTYDGAGREVATSQRMDAEHFATTTRSLDALGQVRVSTDAMGHATHYVFDAAGREVMRVDALGYVTQSAYDALGALTRISRYANVTVGAWDAAHLPVVVQSAPNAPQPDDTAPGAYVPVDAARDSLTLLEHDALGRQTRTVDAESGVESTTYNAFGEKATFTNKVGGRFTYAYDALGHLVEETLPVSAPDAQGSARAVVNRYVYNAFGDKLTQTEAVGLPEARDVSFVYDALGRLTHKMLPAVRVYDPVQDRYTNNVRPTETWAYDAFNNVIRYADANSNATHTWYDASNRKVAEVNAAGFLNTQDLDAAGNVITRRTYANAVRVGAQAWLDPRQLPEILASAPQDAVARVYLITDAHNDRVVRFTYDQLNRPTSTRIEAMRVGAIDAASGDYQIRTADIVTRTTYDALGRMLTRTDGNGHVTRHLYDRAGREVAKVDPARFVTIWTRDGGDQVLSERRYAYALSSSLNLSDTTSLAQLTDTSALAPSAQDRVTEFRYDRLGRKVRETVNRVQSGRVDPHTGQLTESTAEAITIYQYTALNQMARLTNAVNATIDRDYDALGRITREQSAAFIDAAGNSSRLVIDTEYNALGLATRKIQRGQHNNDRVSATAYDAAGRLIIETDAAGQITRFDRDAQDNITQKTVLSLRDAQGNVRSEATRYRYDGLNRQTHTHDVGTGFITESRYNAFGEVDAKRSYVGIEPRIWQEVAQYDRAGRVWKSNAQDGITKAFVFDANGNTTLKMDSGSVDLASLTFEQIINLEETNHHVSVYDARNLLLKSLDPSFEVRNESVVITANQAAQSLFVGSNSTIQLDVPPVTSSTPSTENVTTDSVALSLPASLPVTWFPQPVFRGQFLMMVGIANFSVTLPGLSALGAGRVRMRVTWSNGSYNDYFANADAGSLTVSRLTTLLNGDSLPARFNLFKELGTGEIAIAEQIITFSTNFNVRSAAFSLAPKLCLSNQPTDTQYLLVATRPVQSNLAWSWQVASQLTNTAGATLGGKFALDLSTLAGGNYEFQYYAVRADGKLLNKQGGTLDLRNTSTPLVTQSTVGPIGGAGRVLFTSDGSMHVLEQGSATTLTINYRRKNSNDTWTSLSSSNAGPVGLSLPGWFTVAHGTCFNHSTAYELDLTASNSSGVINRARAEYSRNANGNGSITTLTPYDDAPLTVTVTERSDTQYIMLGVRSMGSTGNYVTDRLSPVTPGSGRFVWDASGVLADRTANTDIDVLIQAFSEGGLLNNQTAARLRLGPNATVLDAKSQLIAPVLRLTPPQRGVAAVRLVYRKQAAADAYVPLTATKNGAEFRADLVGLAPPQSGNAVYEYVYDALDANGNVLGRHNGTFTLSATSSCATRLDWVIQDLGSRTTRIQRSFVYNAFGGVASETDGLGRVTKFNYNTQGKLIQKISPETSATLANGLVQRLRPTTRTIFDLSGRVVGSLDANGNLRTQTWRSGDTPTDLILERAADGGLTRHRYDYFGDRRFSVNALWSSTGSEAGYVTEYLYDALGRVIEMRLPERLANSPGNDTDTSVRAIERYTYDGAGRRIAHNNALGFIDTTDYDTLGRVIRTTSAQGFYTDYTYTYRTDLTGVGGKLVAGWRKITTDPLGRTQIEHQDVSGRITWRQDLGGHTFAYVYNHAGWLTAQSGSTGQKIAREYYANGMVKVIWDQTTGTYTHYQYDVAGNRTFEGYISLRDPADANGGVREHHQYAQLEYDELNRLTRVLDPRAEIRYEYDANGNRRRIYASYHDGVNGARATQEYWYVYDGENRFLITQGALASTRSTSPTDTAARVVSGKTGVAIAYNLLGQRVQASNGVDGTQETYRYSAEGYLIDTLIDTNPADTTPGVLRSRRSADLAGRVTTYAEYDSTGRSVNYVRASTYDRDNRLLGESGTDGTTTYRYYTDATDTAATASASGAGALAVSTNANNNTTVSTYTAYEYWDAPKEKALTNQAYNPDLGERNNSWRPGNARLYHDVNGNLTRALDAGADGILGSADDRALRYITNAQGLILNREESSANRIARVHRYYYANGTRVGDVGNDGSSRVDYAQAIASRGENRDYKNWRPIASADFDQNYEPVGPGYPGPTPGSYTVRAGDTLAVIAAVLWGDQSLWYLLAEANALSGSETLTPGQVLSVPNKLTNVHHNAGTSRVYNPVEAMGDTRPTLPDVPPPPPAKKCSAILQILVIIVVVVVSIYTAGAATGFFASAGMAGGSAAATTMGAGVAAMSGAAGAAGVAGAMVGATVGGIVGQGLTMAAGYQEKFSWRQVGASAVGVGITAGMGAALQGTSMAATLNNQWGAVAKAAVSSAATQAINVKLGFQEEFSWRSVAAAGAEAFVSHHVQGMGALAQKGMGFNPATDASFWTRSFVSNAAAIVAKNEVYNRPFNLAEVATEAIGDTVRDAISAKFDGSRQDEQDRSQMRDASKSQGTQPVLKLTKSASQAFDRNLAQSITSGEPESVLTAQMLFEDEPIGPAANGREITHSKVFIQSAKDLGNRIGSFATDFWYGTGQFIPATKSHDTAGSALMDTLRVGWNLAVDAAMISDEVLGLGKMGRTAWKMMGVDVPDLSALRRPYDNPAFGLSMELLGPAVPATKVLGGGRTLGGAAYVGGKYVHDLKPLSNLELYGQAISRTPEEAVQLLQKVGHDAEYLSQYQVVKLSDDRYVRIVRDLGFDFDATYGNVPFGAKSVRFEGNIASQVGRDSTNLRIPVYVRKEIFDSDEALVQVLSHEISEIEALRDLAQKSISTTQYKNHVRPDRPENLHWKAVQEGDWWLQRFRDMRKEK